MAALTQSGRCGYSSATCCLWSRRLQPTPPHSRVTGAALLSCAHSYASRGDLLRSAGASPPHKQTRVCTLFMVSGAHVVRLSPCPSPSLTRCPLPRYSLTCHSLPLHSTHIQEDSRVISPLLEPGMLLAHLLGRAGLLHSFQGEPCLSEPLDLDIYQEVAFTRCPPIAASSPRMRQWPGTLPGVPAPEHERSAQAAVDNSGQVVYNIWARAS